MRKRNRRLPPVEGDAVAGARSFLDTQSTAMRTWDNSALPNRREHEQALAYIAALLRLVESEVSE